MDESMNEMTSDECWDFLRGREFGRLAFRLADEVHITPVNYAVDHDPATGRRTLLFRTAEGSKLLGVMMHGEVAFEVDEFDDERAASVILRGPARRLEEDEAHRAEHVPLRPWVATPKYNVVEIEPGELSGRRFELSRPWLHLMPRDDL
jgi:nitroimidazol reductase NimA-like FMN-containing flavoprotein (pyridoxamine 5'-phosphate oxidase superfamily)